MPGFVILPGLDGWAEPRAELAAHLEPVGPATAVDYPPTEMRSMAQLESLARAALDETASPSILIAESFSGPLAIRIAADPPPHLAALVLVATFAVAPHRWARFAISRRLVGRPPPSPFLRLALVGTDAPPELVDLARRAIARVDGEILASRLRHTLELDVRDDLARVRLPILHIAPTADRLLGRSASLHGINPRIERRHLGGPHALIQRHPARVAEAITDFVRRHLSAQQSNE